MKKAAIIILTLFVFLGTSCSPDAMKTEDIDDYSVLIIKINDEYFEAVGKCNQVYCEQGGEYPEMNDGEFAVICANVKTYEGGEAGYTGNPFIKTLKSYQILSPDDASKKYHIPEITLSNNFSYDGLQMYHSDDDLFYVFLGKGGYWVYKNGDYIGTYDNLIAQFLESLK